MNATSATSGSHKAETEQSIGEFMEFHRWFYEIFMFSMKYLFYFLYFSLCRVFQSHPQRNNKKQFFSALIIMSLYKDPNYLFFLFYEH